MDTVVNALVAAGTIAVAVVAALASRSAREIAKADRSEAAKRETTARRHANMRSDLDHLVAIAEVLEAQESQPPTPREDSEFGVVPAEATTILRARVKASPVRLPAVEAYVAGEPAPLAYVDKIWREYSDLLARDDRDGMVSEFAAKPAMVARAELYGKIRDLRSQLLGSAEERGADD